MIRVIYSPRWFYGTDIVVDIISAIVLMCIALFSLTYYTKKKNTNYLRLSSSFLILSFSFIFKILMNYTIYFKEIHTRHFIDVSLTYETIRTSDALFFFGFLLFRLLTLLGFYLLYSLYEKPSKATSILIVYLLIISTYFTHSTYYAFHATSLILLILITIHHFKRMQKKPMITTKLLFTSFSIICMSQFFFIFIARSSEIYAYGEIIQLIGYIGLLITFGLVLYLGKKTITNRHH